MKQKFSMLSFVRINEDLPEGMRHFEAGLEAIVHASYSQLYGGRAIDSYCLYIIKDGKIYNRISWYPESVLTLMPEQDFAKAENMIEEYNFR